ncbi:thioredoxin family protein [Parerythrobacter aestuarii]|uniref:thioredoxin family protein n=1 Tax=Parerythrobacter aestuarii TaxID=3020909 RepID=UPI0024DEB4F7|nr:thioredoxin family protein [Parerythrobacter aestuarii]
MMRNIRKAIPYAAVLAAAPLIGPSASLAGETEAAAPDHPEATPFDKKADATANVDAALVRANERGALVMIVLGANWCHDSRALAGWLQSERFAGLIEDRYEVVYVDVGHPQKGKGRNLDIAARFGLEEEVTNTPTLLLLDNEGRLLNADTAKSWRNAASRSGEEIYDELALMATTEMARE